MGHDLSWSPRVKILGVWFSRSPSFNYLFTYLHTTAFKRFNYLKELGSRSRGINCSHMLRLINCLIRSFLKYACPILINSCSSYLRSQEITYIAAV